MGIMPSAGKSKSDRAQGREGQHLRKREIITLPANFSLTHNYGAVVGAIDALRNCGGLFSVDFGEMKQVSAAAALMLAAEMDICVRRTATPGKRPRKLKVSGGAWHTEAGALLKEMGFFNFLQVRPMIMGEQNKGGRVFIKFISGVGLDGYGIRTIIKNVEKAFAIEAIPPEIRLPMLAGMGEAILNTYHHAYDDKSKLHRWWISASVNKDTNELKVICYDRGKTIPKTLLDSQRWSGFLAGLKQKRDENLIFAALKERQSSTRKENRGYGLKDLLEFIDANNQGILEVYSREGMVEYKKEPNEGAVMTPRPLSRVLQGTLVVWSIIPEPLREKT